VAQGVASVTCAGAPPQTLQAFRQEVASDRLSCGNVDAIVSRLSELCDADDAEPLLDFWCV
jgi:hypothetical protein